MADASMGEALGWVGVALGAAGVIISGLARYAVEQRDKTVDKRLDMLEKAEAASHKANEDEARAFTAALHKQQLEHAKLEGEVSVLKKTSEAAERDLKDIKADMVTRKEWLDAQDRIEAFQTRLETKIDQLARSRWIPTPGQMTAVRPREDEALDDFKPGPRKPRG